MKHFEQRTKKNLPKIKEVFIKHHVEKLRVKVFEFDLLVDLLSVATDLTHLSLDQGFAMRQTRAEKVDLPNLKYLKIDYASEFVDHIKGPKIETLEVTENFVSIKSANWGDFLRTCNELKQLTLYEFLFDSDFSTYNFKLEQIAILNLGVDSLTYGREMIKKFLRSQVKSLKVLKLDIIIKELFNFVLNELQVEDFKFHVDIDKSTEQVLINRSVKTLKTSMPSFSDHSVEFYGKVIFSIRSIETFDISLSSENEVKILQFIAAAMPKLRNLTIQTNSLKYERYNFVPNVRIEQVENLKIKNLPTEFERRITFLTCCPNVKKLRILKDFCEIKTEEFQILVRSLKSLEEIYVENTLEITDKTVELLVQSRVRKLTIIDRKLNQEVPERLKNSRVQVVVLVRQKFIRYEDFDYKFSFEESDEFSDDDDYWQGGRRERRERSKTTKPVVKTK